jgi:5-methylcytosine-specific restriction protein A
MIKSAGRILPRRGQLYGGQWRKARRLFLARHPLCRMCQTQGKIATATVVDHIRPHRGDLVLFWDQTNWQALCKSHHDSAKQREEKSGKLIGNDVSGESTHPDHHWNK